MGYYRNSEGYWDSTAGAALSHIARQEKKGRKQMGKTRSCRRTEDQNRIHEKAVKMRKMTDEQLVHYVEDRARKAESEGYNRGVKEKPAEPVKDNYDVAHFIELIAALPGIGHATMNKIKICAREEGYIEC